MRLKTLLLATLVSIGSFNASAKEGEKLVIGASAPSVLTTYYTAKANTVSAVKTALQANGFTVLASTTPLKGLSVLTITNAQLQKTNSFLATLNVLVNADKEVRVQNPSYFGAAYLQGAFKYGQFSDTLKALQKALGELSGTKDEFALDKLAKYQFMMGMPYLNDTITVGEGTDLTSKLKGNKYVAYSLVLPNGTTLVGHNLIGRTNKFLKKIDASDNALILPYQSMITKDKAVILDPKYYLALSLPLLSMGEFMKIASAPAEIEKDIKRTFK
jgi:hypothetical protein